MDAANLGEFPDYHFDLVTCFMSLQDIRSFKKAISEVTRVLKSNGRFVFSIFHPCSEKIRLNKHIGRRNLRAERVRRGLEHEEEADKIRK